MKWTANLRRSIPRKSTILSMVRKFKKHFFASQNFHLDLIDAADPRGQERFWIGLLLTRHSTTSEIVSCAWLDGTKFDYGECKIGSGKKPWADCHDHHGPEPNNFPGIQHCVNFAHGSSQAYVSIYKAHSC